MHKIGVIFKPLFSVDKETGCYSWARPVNKRTGYGKKQFAGKTLLAHRWAWQCKFGKIPRNKVINHICKNRKCVNTAHLELVSQAENCRYGHGTKLKVVQARYIKGLAANRSQKLAVKLAKRFSVSPSLIRDIWSGRAWR